MDLPAVEARPSTLRARAPDSAKSPIVTAIRATRAKLTTRSACADFAKTSFDCS